MRQQPTAVAVEHIIGISVITGIVSLPHQLAHPGRFSHLTRSDQNLHQHRCVGQALGQSLNKGSLKSVGHGYFNKILGMLSINDRHT